MYYLAVMLEGGEDPRFIVRRMIILASEDIGNADPAALSLATAAAQAVEHVGLPEARYALAQAAIYLARAPKSTPPARAVGGPTPRARARRRCGARGCAPDPGRGRIAAAVMTTPIGHPGHVSSQELAPEGVVGEQLYEPDRRRPRSAKRLESGFRQKRAAEPR